MPGVAFFDLLVRAYPAAMEFRSMLLLEFRGPLTRKDHSQTRRWGRPGV
jgi:hypothetical protein